MTVGQDFAGQNMLPDVLGINPEDHGRLTSPIKELREKYELLPAFLRVRGLVRQHIDSFNYFINQELRKIIRAKGNERITCDTDANFYLRYVVLFSAAVCQFAALALCVSMSFVVTPLPVTRC